MLLHTLIFLSVSSERSFATEPLPDDIIYNGREFITLDFPLNQHMELHKDLYVNWFSKPLCSSAWNAHKAYWSIEGNVLYLIRLEFDPCSEKLNVPLNRFFSGATTKVKANWFTGKINLYNKENASKREKEIILYFKEGKLTTLD